MALTAKKVYAILKRQISDMEAKLNSPVRYRGTVATADLLPLNPDIGDMYNIESKSIYGEAGMNVAWNGVVWDTMGAPVDMSLYLTKEGADTTIQNMVNEYLEKNPVKPGATTEQAQQIEQNRTDIGSLKTDLSTKITKFYKSNQGGTHIADSDNGKIMDMMIYGKSSQDGTPTPENPVEIKSVMNPTVKVTNEDGLKVQSVTLNNITLNAIPVSSGGNVTIDGQQYIADYVDVERGKVVRMCENVTFNGAENENWTLWNENKDNLWSFMFQNSVKTFVNESASKCNRFEFDENESIDRTFWLCNPSGNPSLQIKNRIIGKDITAFKSWLSNNPIDVIYPLRIPIEEELTAEHAQALKELATYYPVTNISIGSEQLDGYTVFNYPTPFEDEWNKTQKEIGGLKEETGSLKEDLGNVESTTFTIEKGSTNVFDYTNITSGKILKQDIGISKLESYSDSAKGFVANQIWDVKKGDIIYTTATYCGLCIYDASGTLQEHFNDGNKNHTVTVDSARFLRYYCSASSSTYTTDFMLSIDEPLPSTYEAYKPDKKISNFINLEEKINENGQNVKDLSKSVNGIELSKNLLDNSSVIENKRPSNWAGQTINDSYKTDGYHTFKAIPVTQNNTYYFVENGDLVNFGQLATYDKDGKYVSFVNYF